MPKGPADRTGQGLTFFFAVQDFATKTLNAIRESYKDVAQTIGKAAKDFSISTKAMGKSIEESIPGFQDVEKGVKDITKTIEDGKESLDKLSDIGFGPKTKVIQETKETAKSIEDLIFQMAVKNKEAFVEMAEVMTDSFADPQEAFEMMLEISESLGVGIVEGRKSFEKMLPVLQEFVDNFKAGETTVDEFLDKLSSGVGEASKGIGGFLDSFAKDWQRSLSTLTVSFSKFFGWAASVWVASRFEEAFIGIRNEMNLTEKEYERFTKHVFSLASELGEGFKEMANVLEPFARAAYDLKGMGKETKSLIIQTKKFADVSGVSSDKVAEMHIMLDRYYKMNIKDIEKLDETIISLAESSALSYEDIIGNVVKLKNELTGLLMVNKDTAGSTMKGVITAEAAFASVLGPEGELTKAVGQTWKITDETGQKIRNLLSMSSKDLGSVLSGTAKMTDENIYKMVSGMAEVVTGLERVGELKFQIQTGGLEETYGLTEQMAKGLLDLAQKAREANMPLEQYMADMAWLSPEQRKLNKMWEDTRKIFGELVGKTKDFLFYFAAIFGSPLLKLAKALMAGVNSVLRGFLGVLEALPGPLKDAIVYVTAFSWSFFMLKGKVTAAIPGLLKYLGLMKKAAVGTGEVNKGFLGFVSMIAKPVRGGFGLLNKGLVKLTASFKTFGIQTGLALGSIFILIATAAIAFKLFKKGELLLGSLTIALGLTTVAVWAFWSSISLGMIPLIFGAIAAITYLIASLVNFYKTGGEGAKGLKALWLSLKIFGKFLWELGKVIFHVLILPFKLVIGIIWEFVKAIGTAFGMDVSGGDAMIDMLEKISMGLIRATHWLNKFTGLWSMVKEMWMEEQAEDIAEQMQKASGKERERLKEEYDKLISRVKLITQARLEASKSTIEMLNETKKSFDEIRKGTQSGAKNAPAAGGGFGEGEVPEYAPGGYIYVQPPSPSVGAIESMYAQREREVEAVVPEQALDPMVEQQSTTNAKMEELIEVVKGQNSLRSPNPLSWETATQTMRTTGGS